MIEIIFFLPYFTIHTYFGFQRGYRCIIYRNKTITFSMFIVCTNQMTYDSLIIFLSRNYFIIIVMILWYTLCKCKLINFQVFNTYICQNVFSQAAWLHRLRYGTKSWNYRSDKDFVFLFVYFLTICVDVNLHVSFICVFTVYRCSGIYFRR